MHGIVITEVEATLLRLFLQAAASEYSFQIFYDEDLEIIKKMLEKLGLDVDTIKKLC